MLLTVLDNFKAGEFPITRFNFHVVHLRELRAAMRPAHEGMHAISLAVHHGFHRTIAAVAHPACYSQPLGFAPHGVAEKYPLHAAADNEMQRLFQGSGFPTLLTAVNMPCRMAMGVGGQPGTTTSTGSTLEILPQLA